MKTRHIVLTVTLGVVFGGFASADDIIHFTNGTAMAVRSHTIEKGMIRVDFGSNSVMAFPVAMVEKVESGGRSVFPNAANPANQAVASVGGGGSSSFDPHTVVTGRANVPAIYRQGAAVRRRDLDPEQQLALSQQGPPKTTRLPPGVNTAAKRAFAERETVQIDNPDGSYRLGDVLVIDAPGAPSRPTTGRVVPVELGPRTDVEPDSNPGDSGDGSGTDPDPGTPPDR